MPVASTLHRLANAGTDLAAAELAYTAAESAWRQFAAHADYDDAAHTEHQRRTDAARAALIGARMEHAAALQAHQLVTRTTAAVSQAKAMRKPTRRQRIAMARRLVAAS